MRRALLIVATVAAAPWTILGAQSPVGADLSAILARVGAAIERYYARAQSVICLETVTIQSVQRDLMPDQSMPRRLQYDLRVEWEPGVDGRSPEATARRELIKVSNRAPRRTDKPKCTDPSDVSPDGLAFLLPSNQKDYLFTSAKRVTFRGRQAVTVDYKGRVDGPIDVQPKEGVDDCISFTIPERSYGGRIWIDDETSDVLRVDTWLLRPIDVRIPRKMWKPWQVDSFTVDRLDLSAIYSPVTFSDPDETIILPSSVQRLHVSSGAAERSTTTLTNYRRFTGSGRIVE
jgi:hypothetical protein